MNVEPVCRVLDALDVPYALIGAHAMAARGYPRFTVDIDLLTTDSRVLDRATWATIEREGAIDPSLCDSVPGGNRDRHASGQRPGTRESVEPVNP